jgi:hypothetical protein
MRRTDRENGLPIKFFEHAQGGMEMQLHFQRRGNRLGLVDLTAAKPSDVKLLQRDNIGPAEAYHLRDPPRHDLAIETQAAPDIICQKSEGGHGACRSPAVP